MGEMKKIQNVILEAAKEVGKMVENNTLPTGKETMEWGEEITKKMLDEVKKIKQENKKKRRNHTNE